MAEITKRELGDLYLRARGIAFARLSEANAEGMDALFQTWMAEVANGRKTPEEAAAFIREMIEEMRKGGNNG